MEAYSATALPGTTALGLLPPGTATVVSPSAAGAAAAHRAALLALAALRPAASGPLCASPTWPSTPALTLPRSTVLPHALLTGTLTPRMPALAPRCA